MSRKWYVVPPTSLGDLGHAWYLKIPARGKCEAFPVLVNCKGEGVDIGNVCATVSLSPLSLSLYWVAVTY